MSILDYWVMDTPPRHAQVKTLEWIEQNQDKKYLFCALPVGSGKSGIPLTMSNWLRDKKQVPTSFILTPQKILQAQYEKSFPYGAANITSMYGKVNYECASKNTTCNIGSIIKPRCPACPHTAVKIQAKAACNTILNYKLALTLFQHTSTFAPRPLLALDESHNIEPFLTEFNTATITYHRCEFHNITWCTATNVAEVYKWVCTVYFPRIEEIADMYMMDCEHLLTDPPSSISKEEQKMLQRCYAMVEHVAEIFAFVQTPLEDIQQNFVLVQDKTQIKFKHLFGKRNFHNILKPFGDQILFMSATPCYEETCRSLDIPLEETAFISADSDFPAENRQVTFIPTVKMNYQWKDDVNKNGRDNMVHAIVEIANNIHAEHNGIIHTGNFQIATWLNTQLTGKIPHEIFHHNPDSGTTRDKVLIAFNKNKKPALLISPSITEGLDLIDDKARFAIFAKIPFGSLGDAWIKKRMEISNSWYMLAALTDVLQGCGRVVRSKEDWGSVYILDTSWAYLYNKTKHVIPKWWKDGYQE